QSPIHNSPPLRRSSFCIIPPPPRPPLFPYTTLFRSVRSAPSSSFKCRSAWRAKSSMLCPSTPLPPALLATCCQAIRSVSGAYTLSIKLNHLPPFTPFSRAANIRSLQIDASTHDHLSVTASLPGASETCLAVSNTLAPISASASSVRVSTSLPCLPSVPFMLPTPVMALFDHRGTTQALTSTHLHSARGSPRSRHLTFLTFRPQTRGAAHISL